MTFIHRLRFVVVLLGTVALMQALPSMASAQSVATYTVEFEATWSAQTHPIGFPSGPHFSSLIGGTHNASVVFWEAGAPASGGIEAMAERGLTTPLRNEVQAAIDNGTALRIVSGSGIGRSPGSVSIEFVISSDFPLLTLVSMLAPSPDWFAGVHGLSLLEDGQWVTSLEVPLHVYDAGTDSGTNYTSSNKDTNPAGPITQLTTSPFEQNGFVGKLIISQRQTTNQSLELPKDFAASAPYPNPAHTDFRVDLGGLSPGRLIVRLFDVTGRLVAERDLGDSVESEGQVQMSVVGMAPGLYFVEIRAAGIVRRVPLTIVR